MLIGAIVTGMGLFAPGNDARLQEANVNLYAGAAMLVFGSFLLIMARRARA